MLGISRTSYYRYIGQGNGEVSGQGGDATAASGANETHNSTKAATSNTKGNTNGVNGKGRPAKTPASAGSPATSSARK